MQFLYLIIYHVTKHFVQPKRLLIQKKYPKVLLKLANSTLLLETFLLQAIAEQDEYDREIIEKGEEFVENVDPEQRYLNKRRYVTKAKFDVYFSVRTAVDQFIDRRNILKDVQWENYVLIQNDFSKLAEL